VLCCNAHVLYVCGGWGSQQRFTPLLPSRLQHTQHGTVRACCSCCLLLACSACVPYPLYRQSVHCTLMLHESYTQHGTNASLLLLPASSPLPRGLAAASWRTAWHCTANFSSHPFCAKRHTMMCCTRPAPTMCLRASTASGSMRRQCG
jgi:hypothetical protein